MFEIDSGESAPKALNLREFITLRGDESFSAARHFALAAAEAGGVLGLINSYIPIMRPDLGPPRDIGEIALTASFTAVSLFFGVRAVHDAVQGLKKYYSGEQQSPPGPSSGP